MGLPNGGGERAAAPRRAEFLCWLAASLPPGYPSGELAPPSALYVNALRCPGPRWRPLEDAHADPSEATIMTDPRLARLADLFYRRRGDGDGCRQDDPSGHLQPARLASDFSAEVATAASESKAATELIEERIGGSSGDTVDDRSMPRIDVEPPGPVLRSS